MRKLGSAKYMDKLTVHVISRKSLLIPKEAEILGYKWNLSGFTSFSIALLRASQKKKMCFPQKNCLKR